MGGITKSLFGGSQQVTQPTGFQTLPGFAQAGLEEAVGRAQGFDPSLFAPAPLTEQQLGAAGQFGDLSQIFAPEAFQERLGLFQNPFEEQVVQSTIRDIQEGTAGTLSDIGQAATAAGGFGGSAQTLLQSEALRRQQQKIGDVSGGLRSQGFQNAVNAALGSIGQQAGITGGLFDIGGQLQQQQTATQQAPIEAARFLSQVSGQVPGGGGQVGFQQQPGFFQQLGQAGPGIGTALTLLSDERVKTDIEFYDIKNGINRYLFKYKGDTQRYIGVMAQEIKKIIPEAVIEKFGHYMMVDYSKLGFRMVKHG